MSNNVTHPEPDITWHVLGGGAMGCLWAAHIHDCQPGNVCLILRDQQSLLRYPGKVTLEHGGKSRVLQIDAKHPGLMSDSTTLTHLLVATKAHNTVAAINTIAHLLSENTVIVLLQNGIKVQRELSARFGSNRLLCLSTSHGAWLRKPFHVVHAGAGGAWLGQLMPGKKLCVEAAEQVLHRLPQHSLAIQIDPDIHRRLWQKFAVNCAINALTVVYDCANGELLIQTQARQELESLTSEIMELLAKLTGTPTMPELADRVQQILQQTADNISSTLQDIRRGQRTEINHFNGYLCELADAQQLPCPLNRRALMAVKAREPGHR